MSKDLARVAEALAAGDAFTACAAVSSLLISSEEGDGDSLHGLMLLLEYAESHALDAGLKSAVNELCRSAGLFPYVDGGSGSALHPGLLTRRIAHLHWKT